MKRLSILIFLLSTISCNSQNKLPEGFSYLQDHIPDAVIELRYFGNDNFIGKPIDGYNKNVSILSTEAILSLKKVQDELKQYNLGIKIFKALKIESFKLCF